MTLEVQLHVRWFKHTHSVQRFGNAKQAWNERAGLLVAAVDKSGEYGLGEATPLPGFSPDVLVDVEAWLATLAKSPPCIDVAMTFEELLRELERRTPQAPPSGLLALQTACLDWWCKRRRTSLELGLSSLFQCGEPSGLDNPTAQPLRLAPLLDSHETTLVHTMERLLSQGYTTYKLKIGNDLELELDALHRVAALAKERGIDLQLRLDANQTLDAARLCETLLRFEGLPIEYIEEPCPVEQLSPPTGLPLRLAFDESLQLGFLRLAPWFYSGHLAALVCKPMILGDLRRVATWNRHARASDCQFVLSHLFDGLIASRLYQALARSLAPKTCHGLFPHAALGLWADWVHETPGYGLGLTLTSEALARLDIDKTELRPEAS